MSTSLLATKILIEELLTEHSLENQVHILKSIVDDYAAKTILSLPEPNHVSDN